MNYETNTENTSIQSETETFGSTDQSPSITEVNFEQDLNADYNLDTDQLNFNFDHDPIKINDLNLESRTPSELIIFTNIPELSPNATPTATPTISPSSSENQKPSEPAINYCLKSTNYQMNPILAEKYYNGDHEALPKYKRHDLKLSLDLLITDHFTIHVEINYPDGTSETPCTSSPERRMQKGKFKYQVRPILDVNQKNCFVEVRELSTFQTGDNNSPVSFITNYMIYAKEDASELEITVTTGAEKDNLKIKTEKIPI